MSPNKPINPDALKRAGYGRRSDASLDAGRMNSAHENPIRWIFQDWSEGNLPQIWNLREV